jgi:hypothetical protein
MTLKARIYRFLFPATSDLEDGLTHDPIDPTTAFITLPFRFMAYCYTLTSDCVRLFLFVMVPTLVITLVWWALHR